MVNKAFSTIKKKLTIFDILILCLACAALIFFFFFSKRQVEFTTVRIKVTDDDALYATTMPTIEYAKSFLVGDVEKNEIGQETAKITRVESYNITAQKKVVILDISVKASFKPRKNQYSLKGKPLIYGTPLTFNFTKVRVTGLVVTVPGDLEEEEKREGKKVIQAQLRWENREFSDVYGVPEYIASAVQVGDSVTDSQGNVLAKILEVKTEPALRTIFVSGRAATVRDPILKDVFYTVEVKTKTIENKTYMFDFQPIQIGEVVPLNFSQISVFPVITKIE